MLILYFVGQVAIALPQLAMFMKRVLVAYVVCKSFVVHCLYCM